MDKAAKSLLVFGIYLVLLGVVLIVTPNLLLGAFAIPATGEVWIRVVGVVVLALAFYYIETSRHGMRDFIQLTIYPRCFVFISFVAFVAFNLAPLPLVLFGSIDLLGAVWTAITLRQKPHQQSSPA